MSTGTISMRMKAYESCNFAASTSTSIGNFECSIIFMKTRGIRRLCVHFIPVADVNGGKLLSVTAAVKVSYNKHIVPITKDFTVPADEGMVLVPLPPSHHDPTNFEASITIAEANVCSVNENSELGITSSFDVTKPHDDFSDLIFKVAGKKFYTNRKFMCLVSPVFKAMLAGKFAEVDQCEIELGEVDPNDFEELLLALYPDHKSITDHNVKGLLHLSDEFDVACITKKCKAYLKTSLFPTCELLYLADRYKLDEILKRCYEEAKDPIILRTIVEHDTFGEISLPVKEILLKNHFVSGVCGKASNLLKSEKSEDRCDSPSCAEEKCE